jgi:hypothetical protein
MIPATLKRYSNIIDSVDKEYDTGFSDRPNGVNYWVYLKKGYIHSYNAIHHIHEETLKICLEELSHVVPCNCDSCKI